MVRVTIPILLLASVPLWGIASQSQSSPRDVIAELPGSGLRWLYAAEGEIKSRITDRNFDLNKCKVSIIEEEVSVVVLLTTPGLPKTLRGHAGDCAGLEIEIRKADAKVVRSNYIK